MARIVIPDDKPELAAALAEADAILSSADGAQFIALRVAGAPLGVLSEWAYSILDRNARTLRKLLVSSVAYATNGRGEARVSHTDPEAWKAAHPDLVRAFDIQFRPLPRLPRAPTPEGAHAVLSGSIEVLLSGLTEKDRGLGVWLDTTQHTISCTVPPAPRALVGVVRWGPLGASVEFSVSVRILGEDCAL